MTYAVRDGQFDVVIAAGPRLSLWPSVGVRALSILCAEMGLTVGQLGGETLRVRGVLPLPGTGGLLLAEDLQGRIHRIRARAIVRVHADAEIPDPFPGSRSQGLIPLSTAERLYQENKLLWGAGTAILGTGNRALEFGSRLLESGVSEVFCVESHAQWGAKRFAGWEAYKRRFETAGGKVLEAKPVRLSPKSALLWELRLQDNYGIRVVEVGRVVSAGPFRDLPGVREYPQGSFLFEMEQTAAMTPAEDPEGWAMEEERGRWLGSKIVRALVHDVGDRREELDRTFRRAKGRLKRYLRHREAPFTPAYQGKWIAVKDSRAMKAFSGVPKQLQKLRPIASIECFEEVPCQSCQVACPTNAIDIGKVPRPETPVLKEELCNSCGLCLQACPTSVISLVHEREEKPTSELVLPWRGSKTWAAGEFATLLNRRGESLGSARVIGILEPGQGPTSGAPQLVKLEVPSHLLGEARGLRRPRAQEVVDETYLAAVSRESAHVEKVEITLNGEKRLVRDKVAVAMALFEMGQSRADDVLFCSDGSCGLCMVRVDGVRKLACQTEIHRGMAVRTDDPPTQPQVDLALCPCMGVTREQVVERIRQGKLQSPEAVLSVTHVGEGRCHGQLCMQPLMRVLQDEGMDLSHWIDWRFPWSDWTLTHS